MGPMGPIGPMGPWAHFKCIPNAFEMHLKWAPWAHGPMGPWGPWGPWAPPPGERPPGERPPQPPTEIQGNPQRNPLWDFLSRFLVFFSVFMGPWAHGPGPMGPFCCVFQQKRVSVVFFNKNKEFLEIGKSFLISSEDGHVGKMKSRDLAV